MANKRIIFLLFIAIHFVQGATVNLLGISQKDSLDRYYLTLSFDGSPEYVTSQKFAPPTYDLKASGCKMGPRGLFQVDQYSASHQICPEEQ